MAQLIVALPDDLMNELKRLNKNTEKIYGEVTKAGAEVAFKNVMANMPSNLKKSDFKNCVKMTKIYRTPSDGGINTKVGVYGYFYNRNKQKTPAPLVANVFEYGSSRITKKPFFRKSFNTYQIEQAMRKKQTELTGGLIK